MNRSKELLETTNQPIKIIAYSVGYLDPLHFSKAFRQYYDCSPSQYRKKNKELESSTVRIVTLLFIISDHFLFNVFKAYLVFY